MEFVLASANLAKIKEISAFFDNDAIKLYPQSKFNLPEAEETGLTFVENALIKARAACKQVKMPAIADDSGLVIAGLNGAPGLYSSRFAGPNATDIENINKVLMQLENTPNTSYKAYFYCVIVMLPHEYHPSPIICTGKMHGEIITTPRGNKGFGYDPIFYLPEYGKTVAELSPDLKNQISHRSEALQQLKSQLHNVQYDIST